MDETKILDAVRQRYDLPAAFLADVEQGAVSRGFIPNLEGYPLTLLRRRPDRSSPGHYHEDYAQSSLPESRFRVHVAEFASAAEARQALLRSLALVMAPRLPHCRERGFEAGEICFCSPGEPVSRIYFVRGNVKIELFETGAPLPGLNEIARAIDENLQAHLARAGAQRR
ncbi:MAG TPA: hypothetical protein VGB70_13470 [Allosphingosinicella sp.]|jgi:hypothetical protein